MSNVRFALLASLTSSIKKIECSRDISSVLCDRYKQLGKFIDKLEPVVISLMYKEYKGENTFFPTLGIYFNEFALFYTANQKVSKR